MLVMYENGHFFTLLTVTRKVIRALNLGIHQNNENL